MARQQKYPGALRRGISVGKITGNVDNINYDKINDDLLNDSIVMATKIGCKLCSYILDSFLVFHPFDFSLKF